MDDTILVPQERIEIALQLRESHFREFKSAYEGRPGEKTQRQVKDVCIDIAETLVAFANADGGELLIGVEDDGTITSFSYREETIAKLLAAPQTGVHHETPLPSPHSRVLKLASKDIRPFRKS